MPELNIPQSIAPRRHLLSPCVYSTPEDNWVITSSWEHSQDIPPLANHFLLPSENSLEAHNLPAPLPLPTDHHQSFSPRLPPPLPSQCPGALLRAQWDFFSPQDNSFVFNANHFLYSFAKFILTASWACCVSCPKLSPRLHEIQMFPFVDVCSQSQEAFP